MINQFSSWILDIVIQDGDFLLREESYSMPFWFVISATGLQSQFSTPQASFSFKPVWNFPTRLIIQITDLQTSYLYFTLCTFEQNGRDVRGVARSRVGLRSFPIGNPKKIRIPLMNASNAAQLAMSLNVIASLLPLNNHASADPTHAPRPPPSQFFSH